MTETYSQEELFEVLVGILECLQGINVSLQHLIQSMSDNIDIAEG